MSTKLFTLTALPAATFLAAVIASPVQASYVCTGATDNAADSAPYFNGDLTDPLCDITEVEAFLSLDPIDESLIRGSKANAIEVDPETGEPFIGSWFQDEFGLGTLTVTEWTDNTGTWELTGSVEPLFFVEKYDGGYDIYTYMGGDISPFIDSWDGANRGTNPLSAQCDGGMGGINCNALTSHISVYGVVPIPAAVWLFGSGLLGLVGVARRKKAA